jgi:hypothetical protein
MKLEILGDKGIWLSNDGEEGMRLTPKQQGELEELLKEFFDKYF